MHFQKFIAAGLLAVTLAGCGNSSGQSVIATPTGRAVGGAAAGALLADAFDQNIVAGAALGGLAGVATCGVQGMAPCN